jgi:ADP-heptose:LPS heptosyltransferase
MQPVELVCRARLLVTPDSGPMHVAGAVGTDCVALFSKDLPSRWAPRHHCVPIYLGEPCSPCTDETARQCPTVRCMRAITADMVLERCEAMLRGKHPEEDAGVTV